MIKSLLNYTCFLFLFIAGPVCMGQGSIPAVSNTNIDREMKVNNYPEQSGKWSDVGNEDSFLNMLMFRGEVLVRNGRYDDALSVYRKMLTLTKDKTNYRLNIYAHMVSLYENAGNYEEAIRTHYYALSQTNSKKAQAVMYINICATYIELKNYDKALQSLDNAIHLIEKGNNNYWLVIAFSNKGSIYNAEGNYRLAIAAFKKAYAIADSFPATLAAQNNSVKDMIDAKYVVLNNIADSYMKLNMPDSALYYLQLVQNDFEHLSQYSKCFVLTTLGQVYSRKGNDKIAINYLERALVISDKSHYAELRKIIYESMAELYGRSGDFKKAWYYQKEFAGLKDSLSSVENIHKINKLERQYDISLNDKTLARKELLINKQAGRLKEQNWLTGFLILILVSLGSIFLIFRKSHLNRNKLLREQLSGSLKDQKIMQIEARAKGEEKERTRIAGDLHDGVVSELLAMKLNLQALGKEYQPLAQSDEYRNLLYQAEEVTGKLRMVAHNLMPPNLRGNGLLQTIGAFLNRVNNHKVQFSFQHYGDMPDLSEVTGKIILMITMELIQNILKHSRATEAIIQFDFFADSMSITVEDNGVGIGNNFKENKGFGLTNVEHNVNLLNGNIDIKSSEYSGTTILIEIPFKEEMLQHTIA